MEQLMTFKLLLEVILYLTSIAGLIIGVIIIVIKQIGTATESLIETHFYKQREKDMEKRRAEDKRRMEEKEAAEREAEERKNWKPSRNKLYLSSYDLSNNDWIGKNR